MQEISGDESISPPVPKIIDGNGTGSGAQVCTCSEEDLEKLSWYKMNRSVKSVALLFNHENFQDKSLLPRLSSQKDGEKLSDTLNTLNFEVRHYKDLKYKEIMYKLAEVSKDDHSNRNCLVVAIMTYDEGGGYLHAFDHVYKEENVWKHFSAENVKSLAGKPKIFLFNASRVKRVEIRESNALKDSADFPSQRKLIIPSHADFLKVYSSGEDHDLPSDDSSFLQLFCTGLQKYSSKADLISILTKTLNIVKEKVSRNSSDQNVTVRNEIPIVTSTLTRRLIFNPK